MQPVRRVALRKLGASLACSVMLGALTGCPTPNLDHVARDVDRDPLNLIFTPLTVPMALLLDGVGATGATPQDVGAALDIALIGAGAAVGAMGATQGGGYSQRQAFEDCARNYQGVTPQFEAQCRQSETDLRSMGPMLQRQPNGQFQRQCGAYGCD